MLKVTGVEGWFASAKKEMRAFEQECILEMQNAARVLQSALFVRTPVWSGEAVRNYAWGINSAPGGSSKGQVGPIPPPRPTSTLALGQEDNRAANEALASADMESVIGQMRKLEDLVVTNHIDPKKWDLIENGNAPLPGKGRNPGGVSTLAVQTARNRLSNFK